MYCIPTEITAVPLVGSLLYLAQPMSLQVPFLLVTFSFLDQAQDHPPKCAESGLWGRRQRLKWHTTEP